ncbi:recombinase family protein [Bradyrhizobium sp. AC87j1]|uniref:recombinase family protein n=1 Tax=Bradyrhizobium sp. AC87j1 TaxID=2055894 RepID=UPI000CEC5387|nr:recombinase family protein [Bradyrhizobium sp. AC87j1]PPQ14911.1 recombinase family protein [Bradyrhizobium sp. AC87j1]
MGNELVVRKSSLPTAQMMCRAAQYVRMSTDRQQYSIQNQAAVIGAYALAHRLAIVRTYRDEGESGLRIRNRAGLTQLIDDVTTGRADFAWILVYDVTRWGRFQDSDESAHYEFACKKAGIKVVYCAEQFENDGSMLSNIVKNLKRVMAAEYSRELSVKVYAGACRFSRSGFLVGGKVGYALQRELFDKNLQSKGVLESGARKYLVTDHVRLRPGEAIEVGIVKWIFQRFLTLKSEQAIARELNRHRVPAYDGGRWRGSLISTILKNEKYIGVLVYNRRSKKLGGQAVDNPPEAWIRTEGCIEPIIARDVFFKVNQIIEERRLNLSEEEMLARLRKVFLKEGRISQTIISETKGLPCPHTYTKHFGTLKNVYKLVGYTSPYKSDFLDARPKWLGVLANLVSRVASKLEASGAVVSMPAERRLLVNGTENVGFRIARWSSGRIGGHRQYWVIQRRRLPTGWIVAIRLGENNSSILDYLLLPTSVTDRYTLRFSEIGLARGKLRIRCFSSADNLFRALSRRLASSNRSSSTKPQPQQKQSKSNRSKTKADGVQR